MDSSPGGRGFVDPSVGLGLNVSTMNPDLVRNYLTGLQDRLCAIIEEVDGKAKYHTDEWQRAEDDERNEQVTHGSTHPVMRLPPD